MTAELCVLGAGNWGTTLATLAAQAGRRVTLWSRDESQCAEIREQHTNARAVPGLALPASLHATSDLEQAAAGAEVILIVIPAQAFREVARALGEVLAPEQLVLHAAKGIETTSLRRMTEILAEETCALQIGVVSGPNIAGEIAEGKPAGTVVASHFPRVVDAARRMLGGPRMMVFHGDDVIGVELAGALKNIVAIAAGMATEMSVGENAKALLITRGLAEIQRLAVAMGAQPATFAGLAGIGDLMVTCQSPRSRNHRVGAALARGMTLDAAVASLGMVAEGVPTSHAAHELLRRHRIDAPLLERVHRVLYDGLSPHDGLDQLMRLPAGPDVSRL